MTLSNFDFLILDYGGVYSFEYDLGVFDIIMQNAFGRSPNEKERKAIKPYSRKLAAGQISSDGYVESVARILETQRFSLKIFEDCTIATTYGPSPAMVRLVRQVKGAGIPVALLSNMYGFEVRMTKPWGRYSKFDYVQFSAESHLTESDPEFILRSVAHFGVSGARTLFVDDVSEYLRTAENVGIQTLHADKNRFESAESLAGAIRDRLRI